MFTATNYMCRPYMIISYKFLQLEGDRISELSIEYNGGKV